MFFGVCMAPACEISGVVKDANSMEPLSGANVLLQGLTAGAATDRTGRFVIAGLEAGRYSVLVSMIGYRSTTLSVDLGSEKASKMPLEIRLQLSVLHMEPVQVTGNLHRDVIATPSLESEALTLSASTVPRKQIEREAAKTLIDAMNYVPGAFIESRGRKVKQFFSVRGQRYPYPDYALDGVWQKEFHETPYLFSASDIESIEVMRSSSVLLTGLSSMAGVINIQTKEYEKSETSVELDCGSFNTLRGHVSHGSKVNTFSYAIGLGYFKTAGPDGKHAAEQVSNLYGKLKWQPGEQVQIQGSAMVLNGTREFATAVPPADPKLWLQLEKYDPLKTMLFTLKGKYTAGGTASTEFKFSFADRKSAYENLDTQVQKTLIYTEADREWNASLIQALSLVRQNTLRAGFIYNRWIAPNGKRFYYGKPCDTETYSGVLVDEQQAGRFRIDAGFRWERTHLNRYGAFGIDGSAQGFGKVSPIVDEWRSPILNATLGVAYRLNDRVSFTFHSAVGKIDPREGSLDVNLTEPKTETQWKTDVGVTKRFDRSGRVSMVVYATVQKNAIALSGKTLSANGRIMELYLNRDQFQIGLETEWRTSDFWRGFQPFVNVALMISKAEQDRTIVRNREYPSFIANAGVLWRWRFMDLNVLAKYVSAFQSARFAAVSSADPSAPYPLGDFFTLDAILDWNLDSARQLKLVIELRNLTGQPYSTVVGYPDFGRRILLGVRQSW